MEKEEISSDAKEINSSNPKENPQFDKPKTETKMSTQKRTTMQEDYNKIFK